MARIAAAIGASDAPTGLHRMAARLGVPAALRDLAMGEIDLDRGGEIARADPCCNPRPIEAAPLYDLLQRTCEGADPQP